MRVVIQRVSEAGVTVDGKLLSSINTGLLVLIGIEHTDSREDADWLAKKAADMRIFPDDEGKMNCSLLDINGEVLVISQFTLHASTKKGNRPSFIKAAKPDIAIPLYEYFIEQMGAIVGKERAKAGSFGADMKVSLCNDGPVTITMDSKARE